MGGVPFPGSVPPADFFLVFPFYFITGNIPVAYNLAIIIMFSLAGISMYLHLKNLSQNYLASFLGALLYIVIPVHIGSMMMMGMFDIICAYALIPLVLLFTDRFLEREKQLDLILLSLFLSWVLLSQIEYAFIFLMFYVCYLILTFVVRKFGFHSILGIIKKNKAGIIISLIILFFPVSFYVSYLVQHANFSGLSINDVESGLQIYTFRHISDTFLSKANDWLSLYINPRTEYYSGPITFIILLASMVLLTWRTEKKRTGQFLFFLLTAFATLILSMGIYGPLFPVLRKYVPYISGMRVPPRFYYLFALSLPIIFALSYLSFDKLFDGLKDKIRKVSFKINTGLKYGVPLLLVVLAVANFSPYFDLYHNRVLDKNNLNMVSQFLEGQIRKDNQDKASVARILLLPLSGATIDRFSQFENAQQSQITIELTQSWLPWNQDKDAADYYSNTFGGILEDKQHLAFYSNVLSIDYVMVYITHILPIDDESDLYKAVETLDTISSDGSQFLLKDGSLETEYADVYLFKINKNLLEKAKFFGQNDSLFIDDNGLYSSQTLFNIYNTAANSYPALTESDFSNKILTVGGNAHILEEISPQMVSTNELFNYGNEELFLPSDPLVDQVIEAEDWDTNGWTTVDRGPWGLNTSSPDMAVTDITQTKDNYLENSFLIGNDGNWNLNISYFSNSDTGKLAIYVDSKLIGTVDTEGSSLGLENYSIQLPLTEGEHEIKLVGQKSDREITTGAKGNWVEVNKIVMLNQEKLPQIEAQSAELWAKITDIANGGSTAKSTSSQISNFQLNPQGISLDINATEGGVLSVAYYDNPWWKVFVDGKQTDVLKINGIYTGCYVASGQHHVEFIYDYPSLVNLFSLLPR